YLRAAAREEVRLGVEARDLVLVLDRQQLEVIARDRFRQIRRARLLRAFDRAHLRDEVDVALRIRRILIIGEKLRAAIDDLVERFGEALRFGLRGLRYRRLRDARRIDGGEAAPVEALPVRFDARAVELDRLEDRRFADGNEAALISVADHEQVGRYRIAHQS